MTLTRTGYRPTPVSSIVGLLTLINFSAAFFALTLVTDFAYVQTMVLMWQDFSAWLLFFGLVAGGLATFLWLIGLAIRRHRPMWGVVVLYALVLVAAFLNSLVHAGDGWTAIMPWGIGLSVVTCLLLIAAAVVSRLSGFRHTLHTV